MKYPFYDVRLSEYEKMVEQSGSDEIPVLRATGLHDAAAEETEKECQMRVMETLFNMKRLSPYYHAVLSAVTRKPVSGLGTCAVTEDTLYYDPAFVVKLSVPQLTFVFIHEIMHIAMQHSFRFGGRTDHDLWNIACDLYINSMICRDFGIQYGGGKRSFETDGRQCSIETPPFGVFMDTTGETINFDADMPESIYDRLLKDNSSARGASGQGSDGDSLKKGGSSNGDPSGQDGSGSGFSAMRPVNVTLDGRQVRGTLPVDIMTNKRYFSAQEKQENADITKRALQRIQTRIVMEEEESGKPLGRNAAGMGEDLVKRYIEHGLSREIRWQSLLANLCRVKRRKVFNAAIPNVDYMNIGITLADRREVGKPSKLSAVKLCIDVSSSVSPSELTWIFSEINMLLHLYQIDGELICWSAIIGNAGLFSSMKELEKIEPVSDGDTDIRCVFEYLSGRSKVNGRYEMDRVRDIPAVFIFTDGQFNANYGEYSEAFGRKTVWVITQRAVQFTPLFGRVVPLKE